MSRLKASGLPSQDHIDAVQTGKYGRPNQELRTLNGVSIPKFVTHADFSGNLLTDFEGFIPPPNLLTLVVNDNPILTFKGMPDQALTNFSAIGAPIADLPNFRQLALIAIGAQLEVIKNVPVTPSERRDVCGDRLHELFHGGTSKTKGEVDSLVSDLSGYLRGGYVCAQWPRSRERIKKACEEQQDDPITVRVLRHVRLVNGQEAMADAIIERLFGPARPGVRAGNAPGADERLAKQQALIGFMRGQLEDLKAARQKRIAKFSGRKRNRAGADVSDTTRAAYESMLEEAGQVLIQNAGVVEQRNRQKPDYDSLRAAVIRLLRVGQQTPDSELIRILRSQTVGH